MIHYVAVNASLFFARIMIKMFYEIVSVKPVRRRNVIIFGAGAMGVIINRVIDSDSESDYNTVAFLDNNRQLQQKNLEGVPVISPRKLSSEFLAKNNVKTMIFAIRSLPSSEKAAIFKFAVDLGLEVLEVPAVVRPQTCIHGFQWRRPA